MKGLVELSLTSRWAAVLSVAGFEATHWSAIGASNAADSEIMTYAKTNDQVVFTHDLDFGAILAVTQGAKPSVVQIRSDDIRPETMGDHVIAALKHMAGELEKGALLTIEQGRVRLRSLPISSMS